jgi:hypothetical protein
MPSTRLLGREYAICYCDGCRGSIRTRRTQKLHLNRNPRPLHQNERICYCSLHPLGRRYHRKTVRRHKLQDQANGISIVQVRPEHLDEALWDDVEDGEREVVATELQRIRDAADLVDGITLDEGDDTGGETENAPPQDQAQDIDEQDQDDVLNDQETLDRIFPTDLPEGSLITSQCLKHC